MGELEQIGVEAIVEGLSNFAGDMQTMQKSFEGVSSSSTFLEQALGMAGDALQSFGDFIVHIAEYTIGGLLKDAIQGIIGYIDDMIKGTIEAGSEFQTLELRLQGLNTYELSKSVGDYNTAAAQAVEVTREQLEWLQKLAVTTPYDATDIANVYTLARSYGFVDEESRSLTESITNFAAGMGLGNEQIERIIINFGQMQQQGKITTRELTDLARGAFVPVNDIMEKVIDNMQKSGGVSSAFADEIAKLSDKLKGYEEQLIIAEKRQQEFGDTTKESVRMANQAKIDDLKQKIAETTAEIAEYNNAASGTGEITKEMFDKMKKAGIPAEEFIKAFIETTGERFPEAGKKMARTLEGATNNLQDLAKSILGLDVVKPIFDVLGGKIADFVDSFSSTEKFDQFTAAAQGVGLAIADILEKVLGLAPSSESLVDNIILGLQNLSAWLTENSDSIVQWAKDLGDWIANVVVPAIRDQLVPWIRDELVPAIASFISWIWDHREGIMNFFAQIALLIINNLVPFIRDQLIPAVQTLIGWLTEHWDEILPWLILVVQGFIAFEIIMTVVKWVSALIAGFLGFVAVVVGTIVSLLSVGKTIVEVGVFLLGLLANVMLIKFAFDLWQQAVDTAARVIALVLNNLARDLRDNINVIKYYLDSGDWFHAGQAVILSIIEGLYSVLGSLGYVGQQIANAVGGNLDGELWRFYYFGANIVNGIIEGINGNVGALSDALVNAAQQAWNQFTEFWQMNSPSKLSDKGGENIMVGLVNGITDKISAAQAAMSKAASSIAMPMMELPSVAQSMSVAAPSTVSTNYQTTNNMNLTINSSANTEPIIQDYNMLSSLAGA